MASTIIMSAENVEARILVVRSRKVILDHILAAMYGVPTKALLQAIKRNKSRFPADFMFQLTQQEADSLRSQIVTSNAGRGGRRYLPYAFTEQGVAMLSSVLRSRRAIRVNIEIMRAFLRNSSNLLSSRFLSGARFTFLGATIFRQCILRPARKQGLA